MRYEFHPEAEVDLVETILYYESQARGLGERFAAEVRHAIEQLLTHPKIGAPDEEGFRKWLLDTFCRRQCFEHLPGLRRTRTSWDGGMPA